MSKIVEDVKTGLKGVRGAGDAIRGEFLEVTDQALDNKKHPKTQTSMSKNRAVAEKGKQDLKNVDDMFARREWERKGVSGTEKTEAAPMHQSTAAGGSGVPVHTESRSGVQEEARRDPVKGME